jgi:hypothetical protein
LAGSASLTWMTTRLLCAAPGWPCAPATPAFKHHAEVSRTAAIKPECLAIMFSPE